MTRQSATARLPDYGSEGCTCGMHATPDPECPLHFAAAEIERLRGALQWVIDCYQNTLAGRAAPAADALSHGAIVLRETL